MHKSGMLPAASLQAENERLRLALAAHMSGAASFGTALAFMFDREEQIAALGMPIADAVDVVWLGITKDERDVYLAKADRFDALRAACDGLTL